MASMIVRRDSPSSSSRFSSKKAMSKTCPATAILMSEIVDAERTWTATNRGRFFPYQSRVQGALSTVSEFVTIWSPAQVLAAGSVPEM